jgi:hypothetical protein
LFGGALKPSSLALPQNTPICSAKKTHLKPVWFWRVFDKPTIADILGGAEYWSVWAISCCSLRFG